MVESWWIYPEKFTKGMHSAPSLCIGKLAESLRKEFGLEILMHIVEYSKDADASSNLSIIVLGIQAGDSYRIRISGKYSEKILRKILDIFGKFTINKKLHDNPLSWAEYPKRTIKEYLSRIKEIIEPDNRSIKKGAKSCQT